ncbi:MAG: carbon-nitrogen hydrolase family protein [Pseudomonadota bacterium]
MKVALLQMTSGDDPKTNLRTVSQMMRDAARLGAAFILTPEITNCVSSSIAHQNGALFSQNEDPMLAALRDQARTMGVWLLIGSLALKTADADGRFANRSFLIGADGRIVACYDKIHMFDVQLNATETYAESKGYRPGKTAIVAQAPFARIGMTICYDVRFAYLYRALAQAGAQILTVPAAFSPVTGKAHWHVLLRARAIETGCFVLAPAQTGQNGPMRATYGHSLAVAPWGEVLLDAGEEPGVHLVELNLADVDKARQRVPSLSHDRPYRVVP